MQAQAAGGHGAARQSMPGRKRSSAYVCVRVCSLKPTSASAGRWGPGPPSCRFVVHHPPTPSLHQPFSAHTGPSFSLSFPSSTRIDCRTVSPPSRFTPRLRVCRVRPVPSRIDPRRALSPTHRPSRPQTVRFASALRIAHEREAGHGTSRTSTMPNSESRDSRSDIFFRWRDAPPRGFCGRDRYYMVRWQFCACRWSPSLSSASAAGSADDTLSVHRWAAQAPRA